MLDQHTRQRLRHNFNELARTASPQTIEGKAMAYATSEISRLRTLIGDKDKEITRMRQGLCHA